MRLAALCTLLPMLALVPPEPSRPVIAWPAGPLDVVVALDRPADPELARSLVGRSIPLRDPGQPANTAPLGALKIAGARLTDEGRTLHLATDPHARPAAYTLEVPGAGTITYALNGVEATWEDAKGEASQAAWSGWWPAFDSEDLRTLADHSAEHARAVALLKRPGRLTLRSLVVLPEGKQAIRVRSNAPVEATFGDAEAHAKDEPTTTLQLEAESTGEPMELAFTVETGGGGRSARFQVEKIGPDGQPAPLPPTSLRLPWAPPPAPAEPAPVDPPYDLAGGDPARGRAVFFSEEAKCSVCHKVGGQGGEVGPDLSGLTGRDRAEVYRNIAEPSAAIAPGYVPYTVARRGGQVAAGLVRAEGPDAIRVIDADGKATVIPKSEVEDLQPSATSIMPVGLAGALGEERLRNLIAFLTGKP